MNSKLNLIYTEYDKELYEQRSEDCKSLQLVFFQFKSTEKPIE